MRKILVLAIAVVFVASLAYAKEYKIGYVDLPKVFDEYNKTRESEKVLSEKGKQKDE